MFRDEHRVTVWNEIRQHGLRVFCRRLTRETLSEAAQIAGVNLGGGPLHLANLAWLGIASAMHQSKSFADVLGLVLKLLLDSEQFASTSLGKAKKNGQRRRGRRKQSKHDPRRRDPTEVSEEAFAKARMVMLQFPLVRIPYRYELTPTKVSEKTSAVRLSPTSPIRRLPRGKTGSVSVPKAIRDGGWTRDCTIAAGRSKPPFTN